MTLEALTDKDKVALAADWVETAAMISHRQTFSSADLEKSFSLLEEEDHGLVNLSREAGIEDFDESVEEEIVQSRTESWVADVREELSTRQSALGDAYPFRIVDAGAKWRLTLKYSHEQPGHLLYTCCLIITAYRHGFVTEPIPEVEKIMQVMAYLVAGTIVGGSAYWFGYPRPDDTGKMLAAVKELLRRMGYGSPTLNAPVWSIGTENDEGVDIVAWNDFGDGIPARMVLYGQVASGKNWEQKSVVEDVEARFRNWLSNFGQRFYIPAMFIPWQQYLDVQSSRDRGFRQRVFEISIKSEKKFGLTIDRGRIAELASKAIWTGNDDESDYLDQLASWRTKVLEVLVE